MTQLILYTSEDGGAVVKEFFTTQTEGCLAAFDHFRGVTKMVVRSKGRIREVNSALSILHADIKTSSNRRFATQCVEN
jgi:hypothetical protein